MAMSRGTGGVTKPNQAPAGVNGTTSATTSAINEIKGKVIETKKKVGGESANYKL